MDSVSIRNVRGAMLRERARQGKLLAITNHRALIAVVVPVAAGWVEHLIDHNWSHVRQSIAEGEQAIASGGPLATVEDAERPAVPLAAAAVGGTVAHAPSSAAIVEQLRAALGPSRPAGAGNGAVPSPVRTVRIGDLSAGLIEETGEAGQSLALTHDRELIGIVIPVTRDLVQFLIEQNLSRALYNIALGEKQLGIPGTLTTLDQMVEEATDSAPLP
jgi:hypothetical protein